MMLVLSSKEYKAMTDNEIKLLEMIRNHPNPGEAFVTALEIILLFLEHHEQHELTSVVGSRESV